MNVYLILLASGLLAGYLSGLLGIGGGVISVPIFISVLGLDPKIAVGTSLMVIAPTALTGLLTHLNSGNVNKPYALVFLSLSLAGAFFGAKTADILSPLMLRRVFALVLLVVAVKMLIGK